MEIRKLTAGDRANIEAVLRATGLFIEAEIRVALEIADFVLKQQDQKDYEFYCAVGKEKEKPGELLGFICFGKVPLTDAVYDAYWIVVHPAAQKRKIGSALLKFMEEVVAKSGGRRILMETSSTSKYEGTRAFYKRHGYQEETRIRDFYVVGDDKITFGKEIVSQPPK